TTIGTLRPACTPCVPAPPRPRRGFFWSGEIHLSTDIHSSCEDPSCLWNRTQNCCFVPSRSVRIIKCYRPPVFHPDCRATQAQHNFIVRRFIPALPSLCGSGYGARTVKIQLLEYPREA